LHLSAYGLVHNKEAKMELTKREAHIIIIALEQAKKNDWDRSELRELTELQEHMISNFFGPVKVRA
jgi:hypothetical protein